MNEESIQTQKELDTVTDKLIESLTVLALAEDSINELVECVNHQKTSLDKLHEENKRLREALIESQKIMNTVGMIMTEDKYSKGAKIGRLSSMIDIHMNDIFTSNKELLAELGRFKDEEV